MNDKKEKFNGVKITVLITSFILLSMPFCASSGTGDSSSSGVSRAGYINDGRRPISVTAKERDYILRVMRGYLVLVHKTINGLAQKNRPATIKALRSGGKIVRKRFPQALMNKLPLNFKTMGISMSKGFEKLAKNAENRSFTDKQIMEGMSVQFNKCVVCHLNFRFDVKRGPYDEQ